MSGRVVRQPLARRYSIAAARVRVLLAGALGGMWLAHGLLLPVLVLGLMQTNGGVVDVPALLTGAWRPSASGKPVTGHLHDLHALVSW